VSFRLVGAQDPEKVAPPSMLFVRARLPADAKVEFKSFASAPATELPFDSPALAKTRAALAAEWDKKALAIGEGGSIRSSATSNASSHGYHHGRIRLDDDRVHAPNEKFDLTSFHKGTRSWARILAALAS